MTVYVVRERRHLWSSTPSKWVFMSSAVDLGLAAVVSLGGVLTPALPKGVALATFAAAVLLSFALDLWKLAIFRVLKIA